MLAGVLFALKLLMWAGNDFLDDIEALGMHIAHEVISPVGGVYSGIVSGTVTGLVIEIADSIKHQ